MQYELWKAVIVSFVSYIAVFAVALIIVTIT